MTDNGREASDFSVPNGWQVALLGKFGDFRSGNGFPLRYQGGQSGEIPFYKVSDMSGEGNSMLMTNANHWIDEGTRRVLGAHIMPPNAIIFAKIGAAIFLERRRLLSMNSCIDNNVMAFLPSETDANPLFFYYLLQSVPFGPLVAATALPSLSGKAIGALSFCFPPLHEQETIATALKDIDDLIASLDALIAKKRDIKQAAMQQLLTGKTRLPGFATTPMTNSEIGNVPSDWEVRPLGSLGDPVIGLTYRPVDVRETGTLVLRSSNVQDGVIAFDNNVFVDPEVARRALVAKGDILICVRNGSRALIGKCAMISDEAEGMAFGAFMSVFRSPHSAFLFHQFQSNTIQRQIHEHLGATINQITNASLRSFRVPFPVSAEERGAIVTILSDMDAELTGLTVKLSKLNMVKEGMMQQLLTGRIRLV